MGGGVSFKNNIRTRAYYSRRAKLSNFLSEKKAKEYAYQQAMAHVTFIDNLGKEVSTLAKNVSWNPVRSK